MKLYNIYMVESVKGKYFGWGESNFRGVKLRKEQLNWSCAIDKLTTKTNGVNN